MGKIVLANDQHAQFVTEYIYGENKGNAAKCYANIYSNGEMTPSSRFSASKLLAREDVKNYVQQQLEEFNDLAKYRKMHNSQVLSDIISEMSVYQPLDHNGKEISPHLARQTAIKAIETQNKMHGINEEKANVNIEGGANFVFNLVAPSDDEDVQAEIDAVRNATGDIEAEDVDFVDFED